MNHEVSFKKPKITASSVKKTEKKSFWLPLDGGI